MGGRLSRLPCIAKPLNTDRPAVMAYASSAWAPLRLSQANGPPWARAATGVAPKTARLECSVITCFIVVSLVATGQHSPILI